MKTEILISDCVGRVLSDVIFNPRGREAVLIFGDYFTCLTVETGYDSGDETVEQGKFDDRNFSETLMLEKNILSKEELKSLYEKREQEAAARRAGREKDEYLRLKKIYGKKLTK